MTTTDDRQLEFRVHTVREDGLAGRTEQVRWEDIRSLHVLETDASTATWIMLGVLGAVASIVLINEAVEGIGAAAVYSCGGDC